MTPSRYLVSVLRHFDEGFAGLHPMDVLDALEAGRLHKRFDVAVVADATFVMGCCVDETGIGRFVGEAFLENLAGLLPIRARSARDIQCH